MEMQLKFGGTFCPNVTGYDVPSEPTNKVQTNLGLAASTVLSLAVQKRFLANLLSTTISETPAGQEVPGTDARLLSFARAARTRSRLIYFPRKADFLRRQMEFLDGQAKLPRGETAPPVTLAMEALEEWCKKVGPAEGFMVQI